MFLPCFSSSLRLWVTGLGDIGHLFITFTIDWGITEVLFLHSLSKLWYSVGWDAHFKMLFTSVFRKIIVINDRVEFYLSLVCLESRKDCKIPPTFSMPGSDLLQRMIWGSLHDFAKTHGHFPLLWWGLSQILQILGGFFALKMVHWTTYCLWLIRTKCLLTKFWLRFLSYMLSFCPSLAWLRVNRASRTLCYANYSRETQIIGYLSSVSVRPFIPLSLHSHTHIYHKVSAHIAIEADRSWDLQS